MSNEAARAVLVKAREENLRELANCGTNGGVGRATNYAPILVNIQNAIDVIDKLEVPVDRMAAVRAAKTKTQE